MRALFIGSYPNSLDPHRSVFFRELIYQFARLGLECTVISPLSVTKYRKGSKKTEYIDRKRRENCSRLFL